MLASFMCLDLVTTQTAQIVGGCVPLISAHNASANKTKMVQMETELFFYQGRTHLMFTCVLRRCVASTIFIPKLSTKFTKGAGSLISVATILVDRCTETRSATSVAEPTNYGRVWRKGAGKRGLEC